MNKNLKKIVFAVLGAGIVMSGVFLLWKISLSRSSGQEENMDFYVGAEICQEFPADWVQTVINKPVKKTEITKTRGVYVCQYFMNADDSILIKLNNLNYENQKKSQQDLGRSLANNENIGLEHFVAMQADNLINAIYLKIDPNLILILERTTTEAAGESDLINLAVKIAERIQKGENRLISQETMKVIEPLEKDIVNNFFELMDEGRDEEAVMMMTTSVIKTESRKQDYKDMFSNLASIEMLEISESLKDDWTEIKQQYKVILSVEVDKTVEISSNVRNRFTDGENIRYVTLLRENGFWKIDGLYDEP